MGASRVVSIFNVQFASKVMMIFIDDCSSCLTN